MPANGLQVVPDNLVWPPVNPHPAQYAAGAAGDAATQGGSAAGVPPGAIKLTSQGGMDLGAMLLAGSGVPTMSAPQGALYVNTSASTSSTRLYINNSSGSGTTWTAFTSAA